MQVKALPLAVMILLVCIVPGTDKVLATDEVPLTVVTVCMNAEEDKENNLQTFFSYMEEASGKGAHLIVFPEIALQQNPGWGPSWYKPKQEEFDYVRNTAETIPGNSTQELADKARELGIYVVLGMTEKSAADDNLYNSSVLLGPDGIVGKYRKRNLWDASIGGNEHLFWKRGEEAVVLDSPIGKIGLMICADMLYFPGPELANKGAGLLVTVSAWSAGSGGKYESRARQNASQSGCWHVVSDQVGAVGQATDYGHSMVINPDGDTVADTGQTEGMVL